MFFLFVENRIVWLEKKVFWNSNNFASLQKRNDVVYSAIREISWVYNVIDTVGWRTFVIRHKSTPLGRNLIKLRTFRAGIFSWRRSSIQNFSIWDFFRKLFAANVFRFLVNETSIWLQFAFAFDFAKKIAPNNLEVAIWITRFDRSLFLTLPPRISCSFYLTQKKKAVKKLLSTFTRSTIRHSIVSRNSKM